MNLQTKGSFHLVTTVKEPIINKKTIDLEESHQFNVDSIENLVILRKIVGPGKMNNNKTLWIGKFC